METGIGAPARASKLPSVLPFVLVALLTPSFSQAQTSDKNPPRLKNVSASMITGSTATITWTTNEPADSQVDYGLTTTYGAATPLNTSLVTSHVVTIAGLSDGLTYHYRVRSRDAAGNLAMTSRDLTFRTPDVTPPAVSITSPLAGTVVSGIVTVTATATDNVAVSSVEFRIDGASLGSRLTSPPYSISWDTRSSSNGLHTLTAIGTDAAGNAATSLAVSVTVSTDTSAPVISAVTASGVTSTSAVITWTTNEPSDSQVEYGLTTAYGTTGIDAGLATSHTIALNTLSDATPYHFRVRSRDASGNLATSGDFTFTTLDGTPPSVAITSPANGATVTGTVSVTATAADNVGVVGVQFMLDGAALSAEDTTPPYSAAWDTTGTNGSHTLTAIARDAVGNQTTSAPAVVTIANSSDTTPPVISSVTSSSITASSATIAWATDETSDSQVEYGPTIAYGSMTAVDASTVTSHTAVVTGLTDATPYHYRVRSRDAAGNLALSADFMFTTVDGTAPSVSITAPAAGATVSGGVTVSADATDNVGVTGVQFKLDGADFGPQDASAPFSMPWNTLGTSDLIFAMVKVAVGPMSIGAGTGFIKRLTVSCPSCTGDDTVSEDRIQSAAGAAAATFTFSASAHYVAQMAAFKSAGTPAFVQGTVKTQQNSGLTTIAQPFGGSVTPGNLIVAAVAWHTNAAMTASDNQGNVYRIATSAYDPVINQSVAILYAANAIGGATTVTISFGGATPAVQRLEIHEYSGMATSNPLDASAANIADGQATADGVTTGSAVTSVTAPVPNGSHALSAVARDAAGNTKASSVITVTVNNSDLTPPSVSITAPSGGAIVSGTTNVSATAADNLGVAGVQFKLDGMALGAEDTTSPYSVSWSTTTTTNGSHTLTAIARDAAGNQTTSPGITVTVTNDLTAPVISAVTVSSILYSTATIVWTTNEASDSQVEYGTTTAYGNLSALNTALVTAHTTSFTTLTPNTLYHFRVRSRDAAGNLAVSADFTMMTLEGTPPTVSITSPVSGASVTGTISVTATASDNVGVVGVQFRLDGAPLGAEDTSAPYSVSWNTVTSTQGLHSLTAVARDAAGNQTTSVPVSVTAANVTVDVSLAWDPNPEPNIAGYKIYYGTASGTYTVTINVGNITTCTITGLQSGTLYYFAATAYDTNNAESNFSNEVSALK